MTRTQSGRPREVLFLATIFSSSQVQTLLTDLHNELAEQWGCTSLVQRVEQERTEAEMLQVVRKKEREVGSPPQGVGEGTPPVPQATCGAGVTVE